jgi:hypothetical protein
MRTLTQRELTDMTVWCVEHNRIEDISMHTGRSIRIRLTRGLETAKSILMPNSDMDASHLCHCSGCAHPNHFVFELRTTKVDRERCHRQARDVISKFPSSLSIAERQCVIEDILKRVQAKCSHRPRCFVLPSFFQASIEDFQKFYVSPCSHLCLSCLT